MLSDALSLKRGDILTEQQLDDAVHAVQRHALSLGMIPISGIMSERLPDARHKVMGFGFNHLREGIPGIHGETGAIMSMGRIAAGYRHLVATSSLSPCPFCQNTLACHLGVREVRVLDVTNYKPDFSGYEKVGLTPSICEHQGIIATFEQWVNDPANATIWNRDIGVWSHPVPPVFEITQNASRTQQIMALARHKASEGLGAGEAPIGAVIVDSRGEVIGAGHAGIVTRNDPSLVPAMAAWRACGARDHWKDKTLFLTAGPDNIAYSMFHVFNFGQLVVGSTSAFAGQIEAVRMLGVPVHILDDSRGDELLNPWLKRTPLSVVQEYFGADYRD